MRLGAGYHLTGRLQIKMQSEQMTTKGTVTLAILVAGRFVYQISRNDVQKLTALIAGKSEGKALQILRTFPGIQYASIAPDTQFVPNDPTDITIIIQTPPNE